MTSQEDLRKQIFCLTYGSDGAFTRADVMEMEVGERYDFIEMLATARKNEKEEIERLRREARTRRS